jgi:hypothetical protein
MLRILKDYIILYLGMQITTFHRYRDAILIFIGVSILLFVFTVYGRNGMIEDGVDVNRMDITTHLPFQRGWGGLIILILIIPVSATIGAWIGGYILTPLYLIFHQLFYRKMIYGIQEVPRSKSFKHIFKGFYPALLSVNVNSIIIFSTTGLLDKILVPSLLVPDVDFPIKYALGSIVLMMITIGLSMFLFTPAWFLIDSGIVYSTNKYVQGSGIPNEVRAVGGWFYDYIKGYSGFSVVFSYLQLILMFFYSEFQSGYTVDIVMFIFVLGLPLFITLLLIPSFILLDLTIEDRIRFSRGIAMRLGITQFVKAKFERMNA